MTTRKVNFQGQEYEGEIVEFEADKEPWSTYILHDGTQLKVKAVLTEAVRLPLHGPTGDPVYMIQASTVVSSQSPEALRKKS